MSNESLEPVVNSVEYFMNPGMFYWRYVVPATVIAANFWALWRLVRLTSWSAGKRRRWFVVISAVLFAPMTTFGISKGTFSVIPHGFYIPEAVVVDGGGRVAANYLTISPMFATSVVLTALLFALMAWIFVGRSTTPERWHLRDVVYPAVILTATFMLMRAELPVYGLSGYITADRLEQTYGASMTALEQLHSISDPQKLDSEMDRLVLIFRDDPTVAAVTVREGEASGYKKLLGFDRRDSSVSEFCGNPAGGEQGRLTRCVWSNEHSSGRKLLWIYRQPPYGAPLVTRFSLGLYYDGLVERFRDG